MGVQGVGRGRRHLQGMPLLRPIPRNPLDGRLHFGHDTRGGLDTIQARLAEAFLRGQATDHVAGLWHSARQARAMATHAALQGDNVVGVADGAQARRDLLARCGAGLVLVARGVHVLRSLRHTRDRLWGTTWPTLCRRVIGVGTGLLHPGERLFCLGDRLGGRALLNGHGRCNGPAPLLRPREALRRVRRPEGMGNRGAQAWGVIPGRWDPRTVATRQDLRHGLPPGILIPRLGRLLQENNVAHRLDPTQTATTRQGCLLRHREVCGWHRVGSTRPLLVAGGPHRLLDATVAPRRRPLRSPHEPGETWPLQHQTPQTHPAGPNLDTHQMECQDQPMQEGETGNPVEQSHDNWTRSAALLGRAPRWQRAAGHGPRLGRWTRRETLRLAIAILGIPLSACEAMPALVAILVAAWLSRDSRSHSDLLVASFAFVWVLAKDGEVAFWFQPFVVSHR
jgi:hypothetical protein